MPQRLSKALKNLRKVPSLIVLTSSCKLKELILFLQLLKAQTKYLGRNWRKSNMKTMSAIYQKVRHRLNDDWAYGNGEYSITC